MSPSRDGTVAVEDVEAALVRRLEGPRQPGACVTVNIDGFLAEFGVSERTERIHDQATKEAEARCEELAAALAFLLNLKDGPRDEAYERDKPLAWQRAREAMGWRNASQATKGEHERRP